MAKLADTTVKEPLKRCELTPPQTLIHTFQKIRNHLAGRAKGVTLDQTLAGQVIDLLACKVFDEQNTPPMGIVAFQRLSCESQETFYNKISGLFKKVVSDKILGRLFSNEVITLEPKLLGLVVERLQRFEITSAARDSIGEAFEVFIGSTIRGNDGQFFTPRNVVDLVCSIVNPKAGELVVDPACGTGGFLVRALQSVTGDKSLRVLGVDKDEFLVRVAGIQLSLLKGKNSAAVFCADSLDMPTWSTELCKELSLSSADVIVTNPPFGSKISVDKEILMRTDLGKVWKKSKSDGKWYKTEGISANRPPQILFIEHCLNLLKPGGRMAIVLPDGILGNESIGFVREFIRMKADVVAIIDLPLETFMPSTSTKTSLLFLQKRDVVEVGCQDRVFMAIAENCGHNRRGKILLDEQGNVKDDFPSVAEEFKKWSRKYASDF